VLSLIIFINIPYLVVYSQVSDQQGVELRATEDIIIYKHVRDLFLLENAPGDGKETRAPAGAQSRARGAHRSRE
jgi:hypothetical protein